MINEIDDIIDEFAADGQTLYLIRYRSGSYRDGIYSRVQESRSRITALVYQVTGDDVTALPEGLTRTTNTVQILTSIKLLAANQKSGRPADRLEIDAELYEIDSVRPYNVGDLPHFNSIAVRVKT